MIIKFGGAGIGGGEKAAGTVADPSTGSQEETE